MHSQVYQEHYGISMKGKRVVSVHCFAMYDNGATSWKNGVLG